MGRSCGCIWLAAGGVVALLAAAVAFVTLNQATNRVPEGSSSGRTVPAVVAVQAIPARTVLDAAMLEVREVPAVTAPTEAISQIDDVLGKITLVDLVAAEVILTSRLVDPTLLASDGRMALVMAEGEVLMAFPTNDLMSSVGVLKAGDRVDLLFSLDFPTNRMSGEDSGGQDEPATFNLLQNLAIAAIVSQPVTDEGAQAAPRAILLTVSPQDALTLKYVKDAGGIMDIVLRAPGDEQLVETDPVDIDYMINRFKIMTEVGR